MHFIIFAVLLYIRIHTPVWTPIIQKCRWNQMCCYKNFNRKIMTDEELEDVKLYNNDLKTKL